MDNRGLLAAIAVILIGVLMIGLVGLSQGSVESVEMPFSLTSLAPDSSSITMR